MQTTIFFGNGINLLGKGESWDSILMQLSEGKICREEIEERLPFLEDDAVYESTV